MEKPVVISQRTGKPKRRKAHRACIHCQRTHLTCDNNRPCERCVARGFADTCVDGVRKKLKYLDDKEDKKPSQSLSPAPNVQPKLSPATRGARPSNAGFTDAKENLQQQHMGNIPVPHTPQNGHQALGTPGMGHASLQGQQQQSQQQPQGSHSRNTSQLPADYLIHQQLLATEINQLGDLGRPGEGDFSSDWFSDLQLSGHSFQSVATNMEYSILSNMVYSSGQANSAVNNSLLLGNNSQSPNNHSPHNQDQSTPQGTTPSAKIKQLIESNGLSAKDLNQYPLAGEFVNDAFLTVPEIVAFNETRRNVKDTELTTDEKLRPLSFAVAAGQPQNNGNGNGDGAPGSPSKSIFSSGALETVYSNLPDYTDPIQVYTNITKPFSYTPGYHGLISYLKGRFNKQQLVQMTKYMAEYRPSFIACTNSLKEEDLVFMEQCFQRALLEYQKFISFSGTPTLVWRRTGQLAAVGKEFCQLSGWSEQRLIGQQTFIVELLDDNSVLEYFELFSRIAFGDSRGATMADCTLLTPTGAKIKTSSIWTLKRDVFGNPMMIVGNFLPILS
ncbi:Transcription activator of gluconeogenesis ERT1-2 [Yarrowia sp. C11]|nr:Transcription activator of gluconeogenesis ERT1-2 [Yarrowia sp. E02]KAG5372217.1 Transcription activator of gluconeogenesis ERT1-2 [Yarrowia sp. C11]